MALPKPDFDIAYETASTDAAAKALGANATPRGIFMVPPAQLTVLPDFNLRTTGKDYDTKIEALAEAIIADGFDPTKPLSVYAVKLEDGSAGWAVTDGHRRLAAVNLAIERGTPIELIPVVPVRKGTTLEDATVAMMRTGEPLSPYETAIGVARLTKYGQDDKTIAKRLGVTPQYVSDLLLLTTMPAKIRNMVQKGEISAGTAIKDFKKDQKGSAERLEKAVTSAKAAGKTKATGKDVEAATPAKANTAGDAAPARGGRKPNPLRTEFSFIAAQGDKAKLEDVAPFLKFGGGAWFATSETEGMVDVLQDVKIVGTCILKEPLAGQPVAPGAEDL